MVTVSHHPQSYGYTEAAVKSVEYLIFKVAPLVSIDCEMFDRGLLDICNIPNYTRHSPIQILYGCPLHMCVPAHPESFKLEWQAK